jgi:hypothetical protein
LLKERRLPCLPSPAPRLARYGLAPGARLAAINRKPRCAAHSRIDAPAASRRPGAGIVTEGCGAPTLALDPRPVPGVTAVTDIHPRIVRHLPHADRRSCFADRPNAPHGGRHEYPALVSAFRDVQRDLRSRDRRVQSAGARQAERGAHAAAGASGGAAAAVMGTLCHNWRR